MKMYFPPIKADSISCLNSDSEESRLLFSISKVNRFYFMGLSILAIILGHLILLGDRFGYHPILPIKYDPTTMFYGVDLFLYVSAFGLCYSFNNNSLFGYYKRRIRKIYPLYIIVMLITVLTCGSLIQNKWSKFFGQVFAYNVIGEETITIEWFIPALLILYAVFPLLYILCKWVNKKVVFVACFSIFLIAFSIFTCGRLMHDNLALRLPVFFCGIFTYLNRCNTNRLLTVLAVFFFASWITGLFVQSLSLPLLLLALSPVAHRMPFHKVISFIGKHSMYVYLGQVVGSVYFMKTHFFENDYLCYFVAVLITVFLSVLYLYIDKWSKVILLYMLKIVYRED